MTIGFDPDHPVRSRIRGISLWLVVVGFLLACSVWIQFGSDEFTLLLWCLAIVPYVVAFIVVSLTRWPASAGCGLLVALVLDMIVRSLAWHDRSGPGSAWNGVALIFWPIWPTIALLIVTTILSFFEWLFALARRPAVNAGPADHVEEKDPEVR